MKGFNDHLSRLFLGFALGNGTRNLGYVCSEASLRSRFVDDSEFFVHRFILRAICKPHSK